MRTFVNVLAVMGAASVGAMTTNVWQNTESGEFSVEDLSNWGLPESPVPNWKSTFGFLDFRGLVPGSTVGCTTNVIADGMWFAPPEGVADATWTVRRFTTGNWWTFEDGSELRVDGGTVTVSSQVRAKANGNTVRKTGEGGIRLSNTWGMDRANQIRLEVAEGSAELVHPEALHNATLYPLAPESVRLVVETSKIGRIYDAGASAQDMDGKTVGVGRWGDSVMRVPWTNGRLVSRAGSLLHFGAAPENVDLEVSDGDIVVNDLPDAWRDCVGFWRFDLADKPEFDSGFQFNQLVSEGAPKIVLDDARGPVLELDGKSGLKGRWFGSLNGEPRDSDPYTVSCWIKVDPARNVGFPKMCVFKFGTLEANKCSFMGVCERGSSNVWHSHGGDQAKGFDVAFSATSWHHLAVVHDGDSQMAYYVDGTCVTTADWTSITGPKGGLKLTPKEFQIGLAWSRYSTNFVGRIDDFAVFRRALSAAEVVALKDATQTVRPLAEDQAIALKGTGQLHVLGDQTLTTLADDGSVLPVGGVNLVKGATLTAKTDANARFSGKVSGQGNLAKTGTGKLTFTGEASHTGSTKVEQGTLAFRDVHSALVGDWSFDDATQPGADASANQRPLTFSSTDKVQRIEDPVRRGVLKISSTGCATSPLPAQFPSGGHAYTASIWAKRSATCGNEGTFFVWGKNGVTTSQVQFRFYKSFQTLAFAHYGGGLDFTKVNLPKPLAADTWYHLVATYDGVDKFRVYLDGVQVFEATNTTKPTVFAGGEIQLGSCWGNSARWFDGCLDDMRVWGRALSADEVAALHRGDAVYAGKLDVVPAPVAWYRFDDPANPGCDSSGNGYDLSVVGTPKVVDSPVSGGWLSFEGTTARSGLAYAKDGATCPEKIPAGAEDVTIAAWMRLPEALSGVSAPLVFWGAGSPSAATILDMFGTCGEVLRFVTLTGGGAVAVNANNGSFIQGSDRQRLHFIVGTYNASSNKMYIYVDGQLVASATAAKASISRRENFMIGCRDGNNGWLKDGCLDEVRVFDVALSAEQIRLLMRQDLTRSGLTVLPKGTVLDVSAGACLDMADGIDPEASALTGAGTLRLQDSDLTLTASSTFAGTLSGTGAIRLAPDVALTLTQGLGEFPPSRFRALPSDDGKERRVFVTSNADGSCILTNAVVPKGTVILLR